jgi:DNA-binding beta-propeller fold protein YncE
LRSPQSVTVDRSTGIVYISDSSNNVVKALDPSSGILSNVAGSTQCGFSNGKGNNSLFCDPQKSVADGHGNLYLVRINTFS